MKKKSALFLCALLAVCLPALAVFSGVDLSATLKNLRQELHQDYLKITYTQEKLTGKYEQQHQKMVEIIKECNDLSLMLYSQKQNYTFDLSFALEKVTQEYNDFNKDRTPYDHIVRGLDIEIDRYARLIEALRRLPPELNEVKVVPDSLAYHNDSLDLHLKQNEGLLQQALEQDLATLSAVVEKAAAQASADTVKEETVPPFILDQQGQEDRDSCLVYAAELLKMYAASKETVVADSTHYKEAYLRLKESYDYARNYYKILEQNVFVEGQTPWFTLLSHARSAWRQARESMGEKYSLDALRNLADGEDEEEVDMGSALQRDSRFTYITTFFSVVLFFLSFLLLWAVSALLLLPVFRFVKPVRSFVDKKQRRYLVLVLACLLFSLIFSGSSSDDIDMVGRAGQLACTFIWLYAAILTALLLRLKPDKLKVGFRLPRPLPAERSPELHPAAAAVRHGGLAVGRLPGQRPEVGTGRRGHRLDFLGRHCRRDGDQLGRIHLPGAADPRLVVLPAGRDPDARHGLAPRVLVPGAFAESPAGRIPEAHHLRVGSGEGEAALRRLLVL